MTTRKKTEPIDENKREIEIIYRTHETTLCGEDFVIEEWDSQTAKGYLRHMLEPFLRIASEKYSDELIASIIDDYYDMCAVMIEKDFNLKKGTAHKLPGREFLRAFEACIQANESFFGQAAVTKGVVEKNLAIKQ